ncbi:cell division protein FtsQ/DivIB [Streptomyces fuscigenes]|uniref:cell division protein FtsQ/DivIB n=1 Tax=Streptomyces fuscigenes TaxID=1528880 RepID=UPI001F280AAF|nr:FtsQ-type POTRA domain-containing protein [Streptomyces fuscigenes]MCF3962546.1 FtsQ-type POTRA domain-containing protein [Streptomyces fuscigenes]
MAGPTAAERDARQPGAESGHPGGGEDEGRRIPLRRLIVVLAAVAVVLGFVLWLLYGSSWLSLTRVRVSGTAVLTPRQVADAARAPLGSPLASLDTGAVEARVERALPRVDSVDVSRSWPHTVELKVTERKPVLVIKKGAEFTEVDAKGVRFDTVGKAPTGVPLLELAIDPKAASPRFPATRLLREAAAVRAALPAEVGRATRSLEVRSYDSVSLKLAGGRTVMWGSGEDNGSKARALSALLKAAPNADHFDVSAPSAPAASAS